MVRSILPLALLIAACSGDATDGGERSVPPPAPSFDLKPHLLPVAPEELRPMLSAWSWLGLQGLVPMAATRGCDVLLTDRQGYVFLLDVRAGELDLLAEGNRALTGKLSVDAALRVRLLRAGDGVPPLEPGSCWYEGAARPLDGLLKELGQAKRAASGLDPDR